LQIEGRNGEDAEDNGICFLLNPSPATFEIIKRPVEVDKWHSPLTGF
jgi:hypothetical protein